MFFDDSSSKEGSCVGVVLISPSDETISLLYKMEFETKNNVEEYEALVLGLKYEKDLKIQNI